MEDQEEVSLLIEDEVFKAKKVMLCENSDYFRAMFSGNYAEKKQQEIRIDVVDAKSMKIIIRYMELGLIDLSDYPLSNFGDLACAANFLQVTELMKKINCYLEHKLSVSNWLEIQEIAQNAPSVELEEEAVKYALFSFNFMQPKFIPTIQKLFWYLSHPYLNAEYELLVFKFGLEWMELQKMGSDALLIILCCLDMSRLTREDILQMKKLIKAYVNSLTGKIVEFLYTLTIIFDMSLTIASIEEQRNVLCEMFTEKVYTEVLNLVNGSIQRKRLIPAVPMWSNKDMRSETSHNFLYTFREDVGFEQWIEIGEKNLWGWNITNWTPTKLVMVCGEYGRGSGKYMRDVRVYDVLKGEWIHHGVQLPVRRHAGVVVLGDSLFIVGGVGAFRLVLNSSIIYNLNERTYRSISSLPDAVQAPAVCVHENEVYVSGIKTIYKFEEARQRWELVTYTNTVPSYLVSFKGYIYVVQGYFSYMFRFKPGYPAFEEIAQFSHPPIAMCHLGSTLFVITGIADMTTDFISVEEFQTTRVMEIKILWRQHNWVFGINPAGSCAVVMTRPPVNPDVSTFHQRYLTMYGTG